MWRAGERVGPSVGYISVAVPATLLRSIVDLGACEHASLDEVLVELCVTAYAVVINDTLAACHGTHHLWFTPSGKDGRMAQTVSPFRIVIVEDIIVWHVAVGTLSALAMRTVLPGRVVRLHDVALNAGLGIGACIVPHHRYVGEVNAQPSPYTYDKDSYNLTAIGGEAKPDESIPKLFKSLHSTQSFGCFSMRRGTSLRQR